MELQDTKSNKSLAEIYEEDYSTAKEKEAGREVVHELDKDLEKKHTEIEDLFEELSGKLDALSNARFTPKPVRLLQPTLALHFTDISFHTTAQGDHHDNHQRPRDRDGVGAARHDDDLDAPCARGSLRARPDRKSVV